MLLALLKKVRAQLILLGVLTFINVLAYFNFIPPPSQISGIISKWFVHYGLPLIIFCSALENIAGFNVYFPGSVVILYAMSLTAGNPQRAIITWIAIVIPSMISQNINYFLGRFASEKKNIPSIGEPHHLQFSRSLGHWIIFLSTFWHPHFAAITSMASGSSKMPYYNFFKYFIVASLVWNLFWGILIYNLGGIASFTSNLVPFFYAYVFLWLLWDVYKFIKSNKHAIKKA